MTKNGKVITHSDLLKPKVVTTAILTALGAIVLYAILSVYSGYENLSQAISIFPLATYLPRILGLVTLGWFLRGLRWHYYLRKVGIREIPFWQSIHVFLASFSFTVTPGKVGELVKSVFLKMEYGTPIPKTAGILLMERLMDLIGVLLLATGSFFLGKQELWLFAICTSIVLICLITLCLESIYKPILKWLGKFRILGWVSQKVLELLTTSRQLLTFKSIPISVLLSTIAWSMEAIAFYIVLSGLGLPISLLIAISVYAIATIAGAVSMLPGGIGGTETGMIGLLSLQGIGVAKAIPAVLIIRFCTLWYVPAVGIIFMLILLAGRSNFRMRGK